MKLSDHPHVKQITSQFEVLSDGSAKAIIEIQTDLVLDCNDPGHDKHKVDEILNLMHEHMVAYPLTQDSMRLVQVR
jgi:hypothetical protein